MHKILKPAAAAHTLAALSGLAGAALAQASPVAQMNWLAGTWRSETNGSVTQEAFTPVADGELVSTLKMVRGGKPARYEMRIIRSEDGKVTFNELPFGGDLKSTQRPPAMDLISADATHVVFDGLAYEKTGDNTMTMTLEIPGRDGKATPAKINFVRVSKFAN